MLRVLRRDFLGSCWRDQKEEMLRSLPVGDEDGGGDQVPLGCYEGCPGHGGLWGAPVGAAPPMLQAEHLHWSN